jgi:hypothetical protein
MTGRWLAATSALGVALVLGSGCKGGGKATDGGEGEGMTDAEQQVEYTRQSILEACVRMHSCGVERLTRVYDCVYRYERILLMMGMADLYKSLHTCVNKSGGDCTKVRACFGADENDPPCDTTYTAACDGTVRRYCDLGDKRVYRIDCGGGGLECAVDENGDPYCSGGKCAKPGEARCAGARKLSCLGTGMQVEQCDVIQLICGLNRDGVYDCIGPGKECEG